MNVDNVDTPQEQGKDPNEIESYENPVDTTLLTDGDFDRVLREMAAAERLHERIAHGLVHFPDGTAEESDEWHLLLSLDAAERTIARIVSSDSPATKQVKLPFGKDRVGFELTRLGHAAWILCCEVAPLIERMYSGCRKPLRHASRPSVQEGVRPAFNPRITVALHACQVAWPVVNRYGGAHGDVEQAAVRRALDHLLRMIRRVCRSKRFKYLENNYRQNAKLCFERACKYMAELFEQHAKLLILRVDLCFRPGSKGRVDTEVAGRCIRSFMRAVREDRVLPGTLGWALRIENGCCRGIHVHLLVAMDGHQHREAATWSKVLGEAWVKRFSEGHGSYYNCYTRKDFYKLNGLGLVHISDRTKLLGIREALRYMTKPDFHIATGFTKNFRKGQLRRPEGAAKRGAPRKVDHGMQWVRQILVNT